ncbi:MAG: hypothetical protein R6U00_13860, partial [Prochlorococcaceae cyanobacterium]
MTPQPFRPRMSVLLAAGSLLLAPGLTVALAPVPVAAQQQGNLSSEPLLRRQTVAPCPAGWRRSSGSLPWLPCCWAATGTGAKATVRPGASSRLPAASSTDSRGRNGCGVMALGDAIGGWVM